VRDSIEEANRDAAETVLDGMELDVAPPAPGNGNVPTDLLRVRQPAGDTPASASSATDGPEVIVRRRTPRPQVAPGAKNSTETP
jgi:hypothetical protein